MISMKNVSKVYVPDKPPALTDVDCEIAQGEFVFIVGHSGSGKSTFIRLLMRELIPTTGQITVVDTTVNVSYDGGRTATFEGQLVAGPMSQGGDSGSLIVAGDSPRAVGLLFAGSDQTTIFSPIQVVLDALEVTI